MNVVAASWGWKAALSASAVFVVLAAVVLLWREPAPPQPRTAAAGPLVRRSVAVIGFRNRSGRSDDAWFSTALAEALTAELAASERLRVVPRANVARIRSDFALDDEPDRDALGRVRARLGVDLMILGSYAAARGALSLDLLMLDAAGRTLGSLTTDGRASDVRELVARAAHQLRDQIGIAAPSRAGADAASASLPSSPEAIRLYVEGLDRLRHFDALPARDLLVRAAAASPGSAQVHAALAEAHSQLGYDAAAANEARRALTLSVNLPREQRLIVEGQFHEATKDWAQAIGTYRTLAALAPDDGTYPLRVAEAQVAGGLYVDALQTLTVMRAAAAAVDGPRVDLVEAEAACGLADFGRCQAAAARSVAASPGRPLLVARARLAETYALRNRGEAQNALAAGEDARRAFAAAADHGGVALALVTMADVLRYQGDFVEARRLADESLAVARRLGYLAAAARAQNRIGSILEAEGRLMESKRAYEDALALWRNVGDRDWEATAINNVGVTLRYYGSLAEADSWLDRSHAMFVEVGDQHGIAFSSFNRGFVKLEQGDLAGAQQLLERSLERARATTEPSLEAVALYGLGQVLAARGDLSLSRTRHEEALAIRGRLGEKVRVAESTVALAVLDLERGDFGSAETRARESAGELQRMGARPSQALALGALARALLAQGRGAEALAAIDQAERLATSEYRAVSITLAIVRSQVHAQSGGPALAARTLEAAITKAEASGMPGLALEASLVLGELEARGGDVDAGLARLRRVQMQATASGYELIARKASANPTRAAASNVR